MKKKGVRSGMTNYYKDNQKTSQDTTIAYYENHADIYVADTIHVDFHETQDHFLQKLPPAGKILDFGCGSGRDTKYFIERGYAVDAIDGSGELCRIASAYTGISVKRMLFQELDCVEVYDGIWACSSILHLPKTELKEVIKKMVCALKPEGIKFEIKK